VFFASNIPIKGFRKPTKEELGTASLRNEAFYQLQHQPLIPMEKVVQEHGFPELAPITDRHNPLAHEQIRSAERHWYTMNKILPAESWLYY
ncbi:hypothetical protein IWQ62_004197, partial [Dispira parvispora]